MNLIKRKNLFGKGEIMYTTENEEQIRQQAITLGSSVQSNPGHKNTISAKRKRTPEPGEPLFTITIDFKKKNIHQKITLLNNSTLAHKKAHLKHSSVPPFLLYDYNSLTFLLLAPT